MKTIKKSEVINVLNRLLTLPTKKTNLYRLYVENSTDESSITIIRHYWDECVDCSTLLLSDTETKHLLDSFERKKGGVLEVWLAVVPPEFSQEDEYNDDIYEAILSDDILGNIFSYEDGRWVVKVEED